MNIGEPSLATGDGVDGKSWLGDRERVPLTFLAGERLDALESDPSPTTPSFGAVLLLRLRPRPPREKSFDAFFSFPGLLEPADDG